MVYYLSCVNRNKVENGQYFSSYFYCYNYYFCVTIFIGMQIYASTH